MGALVSAEMKKAQALLRKGLTAAQASKKSGISQSSISQSKVCQGIIAEQKAKLAASLAAE